MNDWRSITIDLLREPAETLAKQLSDSEVELSTLGTSSSHGITTLYSSGARQLIEAMQLAHIRRLILVSSVVTGPSGEELCWYLGLVRRLLASHYVDMAHMEQLVMDTADIDWTIIRAPRLTSGKKTGQYRVALRHAPKGKHYTSRADLAGFMH